VAGAGARSWWPGLIAGGVLFCGQAVAEPPSHTAIEDGIAAPLGGLAGDASRGQAIVANRQVGLCVLCHQMPDALGVPVAFQGNLAPSIAGAGSRWNPAQLRLRIVDSRKLNPDSIMPAYHRTEGLARVGAAWQGRPVLDAQQVEDVVAFLVTLK
jgi:sulfur-oxidizing protein SoxX